MCRAARLSTEPVVVSICGLEYGRDHQGQVAAIDVIARLNACCPPRVGTANSAERRMVDSGPNT